MKPQPRIYLSPPHMSAVERELLLDAFDSNWVAPLGPHVDAFESELAQRVGIRSAAALNSGTAALHLALLLTGVKPGDEVLTSTLTFAASANAITYVGATPVFIDSDPKTWSMEPGLLREELQACAARNRLPGAVLAVDLYGQCPDYKPIIETCREYGVPLIEDAAEALGATYGDRSAGTLGDVGVFSFNGNKILTTSGGGMLVSDDESLVKQARNLASQAREPALHYEHQRVGYNYRLSNLLAAVGRGQLRALDERLRQRKANRQFYETILGQRSGITFMPIADHGTPNHWLTCVLVDEAQFGASVTSICHQLEQLNIEARPVWKPMHQQPAFAQCRTRGGGVADRLFECGLCLPSGSNLSAPEHRRIEAAFKAIGRA